MKAIVIEQHGSAENLKLVDSPQPEPKKNEVLVRLKAASLNHVDIWVRQGIAAYPVKLPHIPGADGAGTVEKLGPEAEGITIGDRVLIVPGIFCGECRFCRKGQDNQCESFEIVGTKHSGTYAEYISVPDQNVLPIPDGFNFEQAAAFPLAYLAAWHMLMGKARLQSKEKLLVIGAGAGVAVAAIQIAKWRGAEIYASTTSLKKVEKIKSLGATQVFLQEEGKDLAHWIHKQTGGAGVGVVFEHVGPATWESSVRSLAKYGRLVTCGATTGPTVPLDLRYLFSKDLSLYGARMGTQREFQELAEVVFSGAIKPLVDKVFPLQEAAQAHFYLEGKNQIGKIVLKID